MAPAAAAAATATPLGRRTRFQNLLPSSSSYASTVASRSFVNLSSLLDARPVLPSSSRIPIALARRAAAALSSRSMTAIPEAENEQPSPSNGGVQTRSMAASSVRGAAAPWPVSPALAGAGGGDGSKRRSRIPLPVVPPPVMADLLEEERRRHPELFVPVRVLACKPLYLCSFLQLLSSRRRRRRRVCSRASSQLLLAL